MSDTHKRVLEEANAAIDRGDFEAFLLHCTDDTTWTFVGDRTLSGTEEVRRWLQETYREPPSNRVDRMIEEGDFLVALGEITLRGGGDTPRAYCDVWRLRGGKLAELRAFVV